MIKFRDVCLKEGIGVILTTREQDLAFRTWLDSKGLSWSEKFSYLVYSGFVEGESLVIIPSTGKFTYTKYSYIEYLHPYTILSYEETLLEDEEYTTPNLTDIIDFDKCKDYFVNEPNDTRTVYNTKKKGLFIHNGILYCYYRNDSTMPIKPYTDFKEVECVEESTKELTIEEIQKELGYKIKIVEK